MEFHKCPTCSAELQRRGYLCLRRRHHKPKHKPVIFSDGRGPISSSSMPEVYSHGPGVDRDRRRTECERVGTRGRPTNSAALALLPVEPNKFSPLLANKATASSDISRHLNPDLGRGHVSYAKYLAVSTNTQAPGFPITGGPTYDGSPGPLRAPHPIKPCVPFHFYWLITYIHLLSSLISTCATAPPNSYTRRVHSAVPKSTSDPTRALNRTTRPTGPPYL